MKIDEPNAVAFNERSRWLICVCPAAQIGEVMFFLRTGLPDVIPSTWTAALRLLECFSFFSAAVVVLSRHSSGGDRTDTTAVYNSRVVGKECRLPVCATCFNASSDYCFSVRTTRATGQQLAAVRPVQQAIRVVRRDETSDPRNSEAHAAYAQCMCPRRDTNTSIDPTNWAGVWGLFLEFITKSDQRELLVEKLAIRRTSQV